MEEGEGEEQQQEERSFRSFVAEAAELLGLIAFLNDATKREEQATYDRCIVIVRQTVFDTLCDS